MLLPRFSDLDSSNKKSKIFPRKWLIYIEIDGGYHFTNFKFKVRQPVFDDQGRIISFSVKKPSSQCLEHRRAMSVIDRCIFYDLPNRISFGFMTKFFEVTRRQYGVYEVSRVTSKNPHGEYEFRLVKE
jgi:hypothetical protein